MLGTQRFGILADMDTTTNNLNFESLADQLVRLSTGSESDPAFFRGACMAVEAMVGPRTVDGTSWRSCVLHTIRDTANYVEAISLIAEELRKAVER